MLQLPKTIDTFGVWTQYANFRFKEPYDILLKNGYILRSVYPNGNGWNLHHEIDDEMTEKLYVLFCKDNACDHVRDDVVVAVRLLTDDDIKERGLTWATGKDRLERIYAYHGKGEEHVILPKDELIKDHEVRDFINALRDACVKYGHTQQLREHLSRLTKSAFKGLMYNQR